MIRNPSLDMYYTWMIGLGMINLSTPYIVKHLKETQGRRVAKITYIIPWGWPRWHCVWETSIYGAHCSISWLGAWVVTQKNIASMWVPTSL